MRLTLICAALFVVSLIVTGCQSTGYNSEVEDILMKMKKAYDPDNLMAGYQTEVINAEGKDLTTKNQATIAMMFKAPDKMRVDMTVKGKESVVRAYDGKVGWEYSTKRGYRLITGDELDEMRFRADFYSPNAKFTDIFKSIKLTGTVNVAGNESYELQCIPKDKYNGEPMTVCVNKKTYFINKIVEHQDTRDGEIQVTTYLTDNKNFDGLYFAGTMISDINGEMKELEIKSIELNPYIDDDDFDPPEELKK